MTIVYVHALLACSHVLVGGGLCLHAVRPITAGEELTTCYLGLQRFSHVASRRELLRASHGFHCRCPRCQAEHAHFPTRRYMPALEAAAPGPGSEADTAAASLLTGSSGVWFQGMLDGVFGKGRFRTNVARDHMLLRRACDELQPQLKERVQEALTAPSRARQQQLEVAGQIQVWQHALAQHGDGVY